MPLPFGTVKINIAIDGYAGCGKSTLAKDLSRRLNYLYIDSGAMYRAVTLFMIKAEIKPEDKTILIPALNEISIVFKDLNGVTQTYLNGKNVAKDIRSMLINRYVSDYAAISEVRRFLVAKQQTIGKSKGVVMDGRDIGTVVFPKAELKIFLYADIDVRIDRRHQELMDKDVIIDREEIRKSLINRDRIDTTRADSPLRKAQDAVEIDNSLLTKEDQLNLVYQLATERIFKMTEN